MPLQQLGYRLIRDTSAGSRKSGMVPRDRFWTVLLCHVKYMATATFGGRLLSLRASLPGDVHPLLRTWSPDTQEPASVRRYQFFPGMADSPGAHAAEITFVPLPDRLVLLPGWEFHLEDSAEIDPADHLELRSFVVLEERT